MAVVADRSAFTFLFNSNHESLGCSYGSVVNPAFFSALLTADGMREECARVYVGDLLAYTWAKRVTAVVTPEKRTGTGVRRGLTQTQEVDKGLWLAILADFALSAGATTCTFDPSRLPLQLATHDTYMITLSSLSSEVALRIDEKLAAHPWYFGAMQLDCGNPLQRNLACGDLVYAYAYFQGRLALVSYEWDCGECEYGLQEGWWSTLPFASVFWLRVSGEGDGAVIDEIPIADAESGFERLQEPPSVPIEPLSPRGEASVLLLKRGQEGTPVERAVKALARALSSSDANAPSRVHVTAGRLPGAERVVVPEAKLREYILNPDHPDGKHKAQNFSQALGIRREHWEYLADQLVQGIQAAPVEQVRVNPDASLQYHILSPVVGLNGHTATVLSAWVVRPEEPPQLVTAYPRTADAEAVAVPIPRVVTEFDAGSAEFFACVHDLASAAGETAASMCVPVPMFVNNEVIPEGEFGWVTIIVAPEEDGYGGWLLEQGHAEKGPRHLRGFHLRVATGEPFVQRARAYADEYVAVLDANRIDARVDVRLD
jgi:hypothetical protein